MLRCLGGTPRPSQPGRQFVFLGAVVFSGQLSSVTAPLLHRFDPNPITRPNNPLADSVRNPSPPHT